MAQNSIGKDIGTNLGKITKDLLGFAVQNAADAGMGAAKGLGKLGTFVVDTGVNALDIAGDALAGGTDIVTNFVTQGKGTKFGEQKGILDHLNEKSDKFTTAADKWMDDTAKDISNKLRKHTGDITNSEFGKFVSNGIQSGAEFLVPVGGVANAVGKGAKAVKALAGIDKIADAAKGLDKAADGIKAAEVLNNLSKEAKIAKSAAQSIGANLDNLPKNKLEELGKLIQESSQNGKIKSGAIKELIEKNLKPLSDGMDKINQMTASQIQAIKDKYPKIYEHIVTNRVNGTVFNPFNWGHKAANVTLNNPKKSAAAYGLYNALAENAEERMKEESQKIAEEAVAEAVSEDGKVELDPEIMSLLDQIENNI